MSVCVSARRLMNRGCVTNHLTPLNSPTQQSYLVRFETQPSNNETVIGVRGTHSLARTSGSIFTSASALLNKQIHK